jgi:hypothetical protein
MPRTTGYGARTRPGAVVQRTTAVQCGVWPRAAVKCVTDMAGTYVRTYVQ